MDTSQRFRVLFVCTGNVCRSPMAERIFRAWLDESAGDEASAVSVASAGTHALTGHALTENAGRIVAEHGGNPDGHEARLLVPPMLREADLVLAMTRDHRSGVAVMEPTMVQRCFTVREAGRLAQARASAVPEGGTLVDRFSALRAEMAAARGSVSTRTPRADDVIDPYRQSSQVYERSASQLLPALRALRDAVTA